METKPHPTSTQDSFIPGADRANLPQQLRDLVEQLWEGRRAVFPPPRQQLEDGLRLITKAADALEYIEPLADEQLSRLVDFLFERIEDEDLLGAIGDLERACKRAIRERDRLEQTLNCLKADCDAGHPAPEFHRGTDFAAIRASLETEDGRWEENARRRS